MHYYFTLHRAMQNSEATFSHYNSYSTKNPPESHFKTKIEGFLEWAISFTMVINKLHFKVFVMQKIRLWITDPCCLKKLINYARFQ